MSSEAINTGHIPEGGDFEAPQARHLELVVDDGLESAHVSSAEAVRSVADFVSVRVGTPFTGRELIDHLAANGVDAPSRIASDHIGRWREPVRRILREEHGVDGRLVQLPNTGDSNKRQPIRWAFATVSRGPESEVPDQPGLVEDVPSLAAVSAATNPDAVEPVHDDESVVVAPKGESAVGEEQEAATAHNGEDVDLAAAVLGVFIHHKSGTLLMHRLGIKEIRAALVAEGYGEASTRNIQRITRVLRNIGLIWAGTVGGRRAEYKVGLRDRDIAKTLVEVDKNILEGDAKIDLHSYVGELLVKHQGGSAPDNS